MGGLFSTSKAPPLPPLPEPGPTAAEQAKAARLEAVERLRRGRPGLVKTGNRGLLALNDLAPRRKNLLGE